MAEVAQEVVDRVMSKIEEFYFSDGDDGGEALFKKFAAEKHQVFDAQFLAEGGENQME